MKLNPDAPVEGFQGFWNHSAEMRPQRRLPAALADFGLLPPVSSLANVGLHVYPPVSLRPGCRKAPSVTPAGAPDAGIVVAPPLPADSGDGTDVAD
jgi:hypothetical protein